MQKEIEVSKLKYTYCEGIRVRVPAGAEEAERDWDHSAVQQHSSDEHSPSSCDQVLS